MKPASGRNEHFFIFMTFFCAHGYVYEHFSLCLAISPGLFPPPPHPRKAFLHQGLRIFCVSNFGISNVVRIFQVIFSRKIATEPLSHSITKYFQIGMSWWITTPCVHPCWWTPGWPRGIFWGLLCSLYITSQGPRGLEYVSSNTQESAEATISEYRHKLDQFALRRLAQKQDRKSVV